MPYSSMCRNLDVKIRGLFIQPFVIIFFTEYSMLLQKAKEVKQEFYKYMSSLINVNILLALGIILLGDYVIDLLWGSEKFDQEAVYLAYVILLFNIIAIVFKSLGMVYRKMAIAHDKARILYLYWVIAQLLSAGLSYILLREFKVDGLYFIIPINGLLVASVSYLIYLKTKDAIRFNFLNKNNLFGIGLVLLAVGLKYIEKTYGFVDSKLVTILLLAVVALTLSLYPTFGIYKSLKELKPLLVKLFMIYNGFINYIVRSFLMYIPLHGFRN